MANKFVLRIEFEEPGYHQFDYENFDSYEQLQDRKEQISRWAIKHELVVTLATYEQL